MTAETERQWVFPMDARADVVFPDGSHRYWSTHCRHGRHGACAATELAPGVPRQPAQCKTCAAPCICPCGHETEDPDWPATAARIWREAHKPRPDFAPPDTPIDRILGGNP